MLKSLQLLRNIGQFDSVDGAATIPLARLTLVYAENGRGKTTFAAVLRSLATGDPIPITERRRLAAQHPPHVVLDCDGGPPHAIFENGAWNRTLPDIVVFDDLFVDRNVYSGLTVDADHRQNLHEFVLGTQGVTLNRQLQKSIVRIEEHNTTLSAKAAHSRWSATNARRSAEAPCPPAKRSVSPRRTCTRGSFFTAVISFGSKLAK